MNESTENQLVRLPLWRNCVDKMRIEGLCYGKEYPAEFFEAHLKCKRTDMAFGMAISEVRRELEKDGFFLSGRGGKGNQFVILQPESNADVMRCYSRRATDALKRGVILGTNTRLDTLTEAEKSKHLAILERMATKCALLKRSESVAKLIRPKHPELLS